MAAAALILTAVGTAVAISGQMDAARDRKNMLEYQAAVAKVNEQVGENNAEYARQKGEAAAQARQMQTSQMSSAAKAALAGSGVSIAGDTPAQLQGDIAMMGALDVKTIRNNAMREAYGYRVSSMGFSAQSQLDSMGAKSASKAGVWGAGTSLLSGGSQFASQWSKFNAEGVGAGPG